MSRSPRRNFAAPFVITAAAIPTVLACNPPPPTTTTAHQPPTHTMNPPRPEDPPAENKPPTVVANPPRPTTAAQNRTWTVSMQGGKCTAFDADACHFDAKPGQPVPPCNPPPPQAIKCPAGIAEGGSVKIVETAQNECRIDNGPPPPCPPKAMCNPPPPRKVDCPQ